MLGEFDEIDVIDLRYTNRRLSELIAEGEYTDLLVLYNASGFAEDMSITKLLIRSLRVYSKGLNTERSEIHEKTFMCNTVLADSAFFGRLRAETGC
jgi:hypothetical protein